MSQAHIWWNKIKNNAVKMYFCERFKIDVLGTSQGRYPRDVFSGRFEDIHRTAFQNCKNMQQLTFQYFMQHIWWSNIENNTTLMCLVIYFQIAVLERSRGRNFKYLGTSLINLIVFASWLYTESMSIREIFKRALRLSSKTL